MLDQAGKRQGTLGRDAGEGEATGRRSWQARYRRAARATKQTNQDGGASAEGPGSVCVQANRPAESGGTRGCEGGRGHPLVQLSVPAQPGQATTERFCTSPPTRRAAGEVAQIYR